MSRFSSSDSLDGLIALPESRGRTRLFEEFRRPCRGEIALEIAHEAPAERIASSIHIHDGRTVNPIISQRIHDRIFCRLATFAHFASVLARYSIDAGDIRRSIATTFRPSSLLQYSAFAKTQHRLGRILWNARTTSPYSVQAVRPEERQSAIPAFDRRNNVLEIDAGRRRGRRRRKQLARCRFGGGGGAD